MERSPAPIRPLAALTLTLALAAGCSFTPPGAAPPDGAPPPGDGPGDGPITDGPTDGPPAAGCLGRWHDGTVAFGAPVHLAGLGSPQMDRDPHPSPDELTLYFSTYRNQAFSGDVYAATRPSLAAPFDAPQRRDDLSSMNDDSRFAMSADELLGVLASNRPGSRAGSIDLWISSRADKAAPFGTFLHAGMAVNSTGSELDPALSADGLRVYFAIGVPQRIVMSARDTPTALFGFPQQLGELFSNSGEADPSLSPDELVIVFGSRRPTGGPTDLWYATRATRSAPFGAPALVPGLNTGSGEGDPALSADGCRLYFASDRGGNWELYVASVTP